MPSMTAPTPQELIAKTTELTKQYLEGIRDVFRSQASVNEAVLFRAMLIDEPSKGNKATLDTIADQFDADGNKLESARFTYHQADRAARERQQFLRDTKMSDREAIAVAAAYFQAGANMMMTSPGVAYVTKLADAIRAAVAVELKESAGFSEPRGFAPKAEMITKINANLENLFDLVNKVIAFYTIAPELKKVGDHASKFAENHLQKQLLKNPEAEKMQRIEIKQALLGRTHAAIDAFMVSLDANQLLGDMIEIKRENGSRPGRHGAKTETTDIINNATMLAQRHLSTLNNTASIGHSAVSHAGMYGKSSSSSPTPSTTPRTPLDSDKDSDDENHKHSGRPRR